MKTETAIPAAVNNPDRVPGEDAHALAPRPIDLKNILVPLDFTKLSLKALRYAVAFAKQFGARITLLHVIEVRAYTPELPYAPTYEGEVHDAVQRQLETIRDEHIPGSIHVETEVSHSFTFEGILEVARETHADLIIVSTHGRTGLAHLVTGSTAENIVRRAPCPVLVVRENEHEFV